MITIIPFLHKVNSFILNPLIALVFGVATVYFVYGVVKFLSSDVADKARIDARNSILWGIVGMAVMFSVFGLINFVLNSLPYDAGQQINQRL